MGKNLHHSGKSRLAGLLFILLILMVVSGGVLYRSEKAGIRAETFREFKTLAEAKRRELSRWYQGRLSETGTLSRGDPWQLKEHSLSQENKNKQKQTDEANGYLLAQTSTHNVYDKLNKQISFSAVGLLLLMVIASLLLALRHYCRQRNLYRELLKKSLELQQSQKRFGTILYSIGDGVITADKKGKVQYLNPVAERMTGWTEHEARDKAIEDIFHIIRESNRERIENPVNQVLREGKIVELTNYALLVTKDGREIPITDSGAPIRDDQQNLAGVVLVFSDRSKERAQRMQLIESEKKYRSLISQMQLGMAVHELILDQEGKPADYRFLEVNKQFEELTGLKQENIIGKTVLEVLPGTEQIWIERYGQVVLTGEPDSFENYSRELNRYYSIKAYCNRPNEFAVIVEDITPRVEAESRLKENERKYRRLAENMSDVIWTADLDLRTTYISPSVVRLLGERAEEHIKRTLEEKMPPQSIQLLKTVLEEELEREKEPDANPNRSRLLQLEHYRADGTLIWTGMHISFTRNSQGKISGFLGVTRNISELKKREQQLRDSEELSRLVMENNMYAVLLTRPDGSVLSANRAACEMFNMSEQEITKAGRNKMVVMDAGFQELHQHFMAKGKIQGAEVCCIRKDGSRFPAEVSSSIFYNGKGELFIGVILNDISERKKATQALRESEQNYRALIDGMNETVWVIGTDGQLIDVNKRAITATGYSKEELLKMGLQGLDASLSREEITKLVKHMPKDQFQIFETVHRTKKGRSYPVEVYSSLVTYQGQKAILSIARDISSRKQMEAQRRYDEDSRHVLYELAQTAISAKSLEEMAVIFRIKLSKLFDTRNFLLALYHPGTDSLGKVLLISEKSQEEAWQFEKIFAKQVIYRRGSLLLDKASFLQLVSAQKLQLPRSLPENWLGVALMDGQQAIGLIRVQSFTNPLAYNRSSVRLLELAAQQLTMVVLRNRMILDLIAAKEKAEESERLRAAFLANMSHEIRTPMNGILGFLSLLETPDLEEENKKEYINIVNKSGQRLLETINDIIEISKIEAGESRLNSMVVNIREILQYQLDFFQPQAEEKGLHLFIKKQLKQDEALVQTDKHKLEGILTNLIKNALKFTEEGYVELGNYREGNRLVFYVKDTGKGIPPERIGTIFERFVQADQELTRAYEGSGLGLAIAKAYLDTLGGEISVQSTPGQGSCFTFYIPWLPAQQTGPRKQ